MTVKHAEELYLLAQKKVETVGLKFDEWIPAFQKAAELGHVDAQYQMGQIYYFGLYSEYVNQHNYELALKWYISAANHNHPDAQASISYMYENGYGVSKSSVEAQKWHARALSNGSQIALKREKDDKLFFFGVRTFLGLF